MKRALLTCCNARFFLGAAALLRSVRSMHPDVARYCFVPEAELAEARRQLGELATVSAPPGVVTGVPPEYQINVARLFMAQLDAEAVVYVDSDAVLCGPIDELWEVKGDRLLAVHDLARNLLTTMPDDLKPLFARQFPDAAPRPGFNSGVLALRPEAWRELPARFSEVFQAGGYPYYHPLFDQPLLNGLFADRVEWMDFKFNVNNLWDVAIPADARIIHFTGKVKPWMDQFPKHAPQYYHWVRHGLQERRLSALIGTKARIWLWSPKRWLGRWLAKGRRRDPIMER
jgi:hypothetical protein